MTWYAFVVWPDVDGGETRLSASFVQGFLEDPRLLVAMEGRLMTLPEALPHLVAASVFGRSLLQVKTPLDLSCCIPFFFSCCFLSWLELSFFVKIVSRDF